MVNEMYEEKEGNVWVGCLDGKSLIMELRENGGEELRVGGVEEGVGLEGGMMGVSDGGEGKMWI